MLRLFNQPYPLEESPWLEIRKAFLIGLFIGLFLWIFEPFGLNNWSTAAKPLKLMGFGGVTFVITAINFTVWQRVFPQVFLEERWTVGREILLVTANILLIAVANRLYLEWLLTRFEDSGMTWLSMVLITFLIGLFPVTGLVLINYIRQLKKYTRTAAELPVPPHAPVSSQPLDSTTANTTDQTITLVAENEKDTLTISATDLLFIESSDNYSTVVYLKNSPTGLAQPVKPLLRSSLSRLEGQINLPHIVRCHRSYIINLDRVERVTGNAQGYKLHLLDGQFRVPVARKYNDTLVAELKTL